MKLLSILIVLLFSIHSYSDVFMIDEAKLEKDLLISDRTDEELFTFYSQVVPLLKKNGMVNYEKKYLARLISLEVEKNKSEFFYRKMTIEFKEFEYENLKMSLQLYDEYMKFHTQFKVENQNTIERIKIYKTIANKKELSAYFPRNYKPKTYLYISVEKMLTLKKYIKLEKYKKASDHLMSMKPLNYSESILGNLLALSLKEKKCVIENVKTNNLIGLSCLAIKDSKKRRDFLADLVFEISKRKNSKMPYRMVIDSIATELIHEVN